MSLLDREGEIRIAKKIEAGKMDVINGVAKSQLMAKEVLILREQIENCEVALDTLIQLPEEEEVNLEELRASVLEKIKCIGNCRQQLRHTEKKLLCHRISKATRQKLEKERDKEELEFMDAIMALPLNYGFVENVCNKIEDIVLRMISYQTRDRSVVAECWNRHRWFVPDSAEVSGRYRSGEEDRSGDPIHLPR